MNRHFSRSIKNIEILDRLCHIDFISFLLSTILLSILFYLIENQTEIFPILNLASAILSFNISYIVLKPYQNQLVAFHSFSISLILVIVAIIFTIYLVSQFNIGFSNRKCSCYDKFLFFKMYDFNLTLIKYL